jgi:hypothetical protein
MLIPFTVMIPPKERDKQLGEKLKKEGEAILTWAVKGCLAWQKEGLNPPEQVLEAVSEYQDETDRLSGFFEDCCIPWFYLLKKLGRQPNGLPALLYSLRPSASEPSQIR